MGTIHRIAMRALLLFSSLLALGLCLHDSVIENVSDFNDFQVFRAEPKNREEADFLHSLRMTATHYDFWTEVLSVVLLTSWFHKRRRRNFWPNWKTGTSSIACTSRMSKS